MSSINNILISMGTSLVVSTITFTLGLKSIKNQSDRQSVKGKYQKLSVFFTEVVNGIKTTTPKKYEEYKEVRISINRIRYMPIFSEMELNGEILDLNSKLCSELKQLETELFQYSCKFYKQFKIIRSIIIDELNKHCDNVSEKMYEITTLKDIKNWRCSIDNYGAMIFDDIVEKMCNRLNEDEKVGITFERIRDDSELLKQISIYKNTLKDISVEDFLKQIHNKILKITEIQELIKEKECLIIKSEKTIKKLNKRVKDPYTFSETFFGAFADIFKI